MSQIQRVLVPVDFSENSRVALMYGLEMAAQHGAFVTVLNVYQLKKRNHFQKLDAIVAMEKESATEAKEEVQGFLNETRTKLNIPPEQKLKVTVASRMGFPVEEILALTEQHTFDITIMGQKGQEGDKSKNHMGTSAQKVMENIKVPVLTVPRNTKFQGMQTVVYYTNVEDANLPAIGQLLKFCGMFDAEVIIMHHNPRGAYPTPEFRVKLESRIKTTLAYPHLRVHILEENNLRDALGTLSKDVQISLLAVDTAEQSLFRKDSSLDDAQKISYELAIPLAVLPL